MSNPSLRERPTKPRSSKNATSSAIKDTGSSNDGDRGGGSSRISVLDIMRVLSTLAALSVSLSYYLTSGESLTFNQRPWYTRAERLKAYIRGPLRLTPYQLSLYNGTDPSIPIYLSLNRTIFDVSSSRHTYGPGGSYHVFAGRDATRAFVTGCFSDDLTDDLRGVEMMFVPVEDVEGGEDGEAQPEEGEGKAKATEGSRMTMTRGQKKIRAEQERREARKKVWKEVDKWIRFYRDNAKYFEVGTLVGEGADGESKQRGEVPKLCEKAEKARPRRSQLDKNAKTADAGAGNEKAKPV